MLKKLFTIVLVLIMILALSNSALAANDNSIKNKTLQTQVSTLPEEIKEGDVVEITFSTPKRGSDFIVNTLGVTDVNTIYNEEDCVYITTALLDTSAAGDVLLSYEIIMSAGKSDITFVSSVEMTVIVQPSVSYLWNQEFDSDFDGWFDSSNGWAGAITVNSGTAIFEGDQDSAPFSRFDGYRDVWPGTWVAEIDVYLDPAAIALGEGFDYSVASNNSSGDHLRDFIFHVTKDTSTGQLLIGGSNNTNYAAREDLENINHYNVTTAGWYTLQHRFYDDGGALAVDLNVLDADGSIVFTETRCNAADLIATVVGGNRYAWFAFISVTGGIEVDNHQLYLE